MKVRFVLIEFDRFIFDNFKDEIQVYIKKEGTAFLDVKKKLEQDIWGDIFRKKEHGSLDLFPKKSCI